MIARYPDVWLRLLTVTCLLALGLPGMAADKKGMTIDARLIWGTNDEKSPNTNHTAVNPELARKLQRTFKWTHYFLVNRQQTNVAEGTVVAITMSEHCVVEVKNLGDRRVEAKLLGNGKLVGKCTNPLPEGEDLIFGGEAENDTAWFVILRSSSKGSVKPPKVESQPSGTTKEGAKAKGKPDKDKAPAPPKEMKPASKEDAAALKDARPCSPAC